MAINAKKINPLDTRPGVGVGINLPFNAPAVFDITYTTKDAIKNNLINFFLTNKNERYLNPTFGGNLRAFIFEQISTTSIEDLRVNISNQISQFFPNIEVNELNIVESPDINSISVALTYSIKNTNINDDLTIEFN